MSKSTLSYKQDFYQSFRDDHCEADGAQRLAKRIEAYWAERGRKVTVKLQHVGFTMQLRSGRTDLRSDMINGWPAKSLEGSAT